MCSAQEWISVLNQRPKNVLISFGSIVKSHAMPTATKTALLDAMSQFPDVTFIWKYDEDNDVGKTATNLVKTKWMPQIDLLSGGRLTNSTDFQIRVKSPSLSRMPERAAFWRRPSRERPLSLLVGRY